MESQQQQAAAPVGRAAQVTPEAQERLLIMELCLQQSEHHRQVVDAHRALDDGGAKFGVSFGAPGQPVAERLRLAFAAVANTVANRDQEARRASDDLRKTLEACAKVEAKAAELAGELAAARQELAPLAGFRVCVPGARVRLARDLYAENGNLRGAVQPGVAVGAIGRVLFAAPCNKPATDGTPPSSTGPNSWAKDTTQGAAVVFQTEHGDDLPVTYLPIECLELAGEEAPK